MTQSASDSGAALDFWSVLKQKQTLLDIASFGFSLALAYVFRWRADDLVWSIWLSSLTLGSVIYLLWISVTAWHDLPSRFSAMPLVAKIAAPFSTLVRLVLPLTLVFALFYIGAHLVYSIFLNHSLPAIAGQRDPSWEMYCEIFRNYWPFLPVALFREHRAILSLFRRSKSDDGAQISFWLDRGKNLIKTHILTFVLAFLPLGGSDSFLTYVAVSAVYFFPWQLVIKPGTSDKTFSETLSLARKKAAEQIADDDKRKQRKQKRHR